MQKKLRFLKMFNFVSLREREEKKKFLFGDKSLLEDLFTLLKDLQIGQTI